MKTLIHIMVLSGAVGLAVAGFAGCDSGNSTPKGTGGAGGKVGVGGSNGVGGAGGTPGVGGSTEVGGAGGSVVGVGGEGGAVGGAGGSTGGVGGTTGAGGAGGTLTPAQQHMMIINAPGSGDVPLSITATPVAYPACI